MPLAFWPAYCAKLAIVAATLLLLYALARKLRRLRFFHDDPTQLLHVIESRMLSQHAAIHVVQVGGRYYLIGTTTGAIATLAELEEVAELRDLVPGRLREVDEVVNAERHGRGL